MWFYVLLGVVVAVLLIAAVLDRRAKKVRGVLKPGKANPDGDVARIDPGAVRLDVNPISPHTGS